MIDLFGLLMLALMFCTPGMLWVLSRGIYVSRAGQWGVNPFRRGLKGSTK
jgi:hypothetical protein